MFSHIQGRVIDNFMNYLYYLLYIAASKPNQKSHGHGAFYGRSQILLILKVSPVTYVYAVHTRTHTR